MAQQWGTPELYENIGKDAKYGIVLGISSKPEDLFGDMVESPTVKVPKTNPDRTTPALQAQHRQVVRLALWCAARHPKVPLLVANRDCNKAFNWHNLRL